MSTRSSRRTQSSTSGRSKPQTSGRGPSASGRGAAPAASPKTSGRTAARTSGRSSALAPEKPATSRGSKRMAAEPPPSSREARQSGRQSKRQLDVSNQYTSQRQMAAKKNKTFGMVAGISFLVLLVGGSLGLYIFYRNTTYNKLAAQERKEAFHEWVLINQNKFKSLAGTVATGLKPIIEDVVTDKSSPEVTAALVAKYKTYLQPAGSYYGWCKKSWTVKDKPHSTNISPDNATSFLMQPAHAAPLSEPMNLMNINGEITQSGNLTLYYDTDANKPVAVLSLSLAPPRVAQAADGPAVKAIPPTQFILFFDTDPMVGLAKEEMDARIRATNEAAAAAAAKK